MGLEARLNICLFPVVMLSVIYWNARKTAPRQFENRLFLKIVLMTIVLIAGELITWIPEGLDIDGMDWIYWSGSIWHIFFSQPVLVCCGFCMPAVNYLERRQ